MADSKKYHGDSPARNDMTGTPQSNYPGPSLLEIFFLAAVMIIIGIKFLFFSQQSLTEQQNQVAYQNSLSIISWLRLTHEYRIADDVRLNPACSRNDGGTVGPCLKESTQSDTPFSNFKNPFFPDREDAAIIVYFQSDTVLSESELTCNSITEPLLLFAGLPVQQTGHSLFDGAVIIAHAGPVNLVSRTDNRLNVGYCKKGGHLEIIQRDILF